jgi:hypothetical protein
MTTIIRLFPWKSLLLMFSAYIAFGHFLATTSDPKLALGIGLTLAFVLTIVFLHPLTFLGKFMRNRFESDAVAFCLLILVAGVTSVLLNWLKVFLPVFMILACEALTRIDFSNGAFSERSTGIWLTITSWLGLAIGWSLGIWELHGLAGIQSMIGQ